jgi:hypothetical protein
MSSTLTAWRLTFADGHTETREAAAGLTLEDARAHWIGTRYEVSHPEAPVEQWSARCVAVEPFTPAKSFGVVLCDRGTIDDTGLDWQSARVVESNSHRDAALLAVRLAPISNPGRAALRRGSGCYAWVWDEAHPKHPNGAPMCVHKLALGPATP